jgi:SWI/SNF chromatin-remodeling complex subunit SWI1
VGNSNGHTNFQIPNNFALAHNPSVTANASFLDQGNMSRSGLAMKDPLKQREQNFLQGLATIFSKRGPPLPPALTGIAFPNYDPTNTPWSFIETGSEIGTFKLVGKDINLFRFWGLAAQQGGAQAVRPGHFYSERY